MATYTQSTNKTAAATINLATAAIELTAPAAADATITLTVSAASTARGASEDYGTGKNYTLASTTCTILTGQTKPSAAVNLVIANNPNIDLDLILHIDLSNNKSYAFTYDDIEITIVDNARTSLTDVTNPGHSLTALVGDGATDNSAALQALLAYVYNTANGHMVQEADGRKHGAVIYFPTGTYLFSALSGYDACVDALREGMTFVGDGLDSSIIKSEHQSKRVWSNTGGADKLGFYSNASADSYPLILKNLQFDAGFEEPYGYTGENATVFLSGTSTYQYRLKVIVDSVKGVKAGYCNLYLYKNIDTTWYNFDFAQSTYDPSVAGGAGCVFGGGYTVGNLRKIYDRNNAVDVEPMGDSEGYPGTLYNTFKIDLTINDYNAYGPSIGINGVWNPLSVTASTLTADGLVMEGDNPTNWQLNDVTVNLSNLVAFTTNDAYFENVGGSISGTFTAKKLGTKGYYIAVPDITFDSVSGKTLTFNACTLDVDAAFVAETIYGIKAFWNGGVDYGTVVADGCTFSSNKFTACGLITYRGELILRDCSFNGTYGFYLQDVFTCEIELDDNDYTNVNRWGKFYFNAGGGTRTFTITSDSVPQAKNYIKFENGDPTYLTFGSSARRTIIGTEYNPNNLIGGPTTTAHGFIGDRFTYGGRIWQCVTAGYEKSDNSQQAAEWLLLKPRIYGVENAVKTYGGNAGKIYGVSL